jgi:hypothetical protein
MGLRSRKPGAKAGDVEGELLLRAAAPLRAIHVQTEAFNLLWRDFLVKLSVVLAALCVYAAWAHLVQGTDQLAFDALSMLYFCCSAHYIKSMEDTRSLYKLQRSYQAAAALVATQCIFFAVHLAYELQHGVSMSGLHVKEFFPVSLVMHVMVALSLAYMKRSANQVQEARKTVEDLHEQHSAREARYEQ